MAKCAPGCTCKRHARTAEHNQKISAAKKGIPQTAEQRAAHKCKPGCDCAKHSNPGGWRAGMPGTRTGQRHSEETKAKLASYAGELASCYKHGWSGTPTYRSWNAMRGRCYSPSDKAYPTYGGRGITICARWRESFENFLEDMGERPSLNHSIDRWPDNDGGYWCGRCDECASLGHPANCRWATRAEQYATRRFVNGWEVRRARYGPAGRKAS